MLSSKNKTEVKTLERGERDFEKNRGDFFLFRSFFPINRFAITRVCKRREKEKASSKEKERKKIIKFFRFLCFKFRCSF